MVVNYQIAGRILKLMSDKKISAYKLCKDLNIHSGLFSSMKDGKTRWQLEILIDIAKYFEVSLDYIAFGLGDKSETTRKNGSYERLLSEQLKELKEENKYLKSELKKYEKIKKDFEKL